MTIDDYKINHQNKKCVGTKRQWAFKKTLKKTKASTPK